MKNDEPKRFTSVAPRMVRHMSGLERRKLSASTRSARAVAKAPAVRAGGS